MEWLHAGAGGWPWRFAAQAFDLAWPWFERIAASPLAFWWLPEPAWFALPLAILGGFWRSEEHTSELQSLMRISYAVFCLKKKKIVQEQKKAQKHVRAYTHKI